MDFFVQLRFVHFLIPFFCSFKYANHGITTPSTTMHLSAPWALLSQAILTILVSSLQRRHVAPHLLLLCPTLPALKLHYNLLIPVHDFSYLHTATYDRVTVTYGCMLSSKIFHVRRTPFSNFSLLPPDAVMLSLLYPWLASTLLLPHKLTMTFTFLAFLCPLPQASFDCQTMLVECLRSSASLFPPSWANKADTAQIEEYQNVVAFSYIIKDMPLYFRSHLLVSLPHSTLICVLLEPQFSPFLSHGFKLPLHTPPIPMWHHVVRAVLRRKRVG